MFVLRTQSQQPSLILQVKSRKQIPREHVYLKSHLDGSDGSLA